MPACRSRHGTSSTRIRTVEVDLDVVQDVDLNGDDCDVDVDSSVELARGPMARPRCPPRE
jgi:hypothetical protein